MMPIEDISDGSATAAFNLETVHWRAMASLALCGQAALHAAPPFAGKTPLAA
ncbi:MAG: hypothetical protein KGQ42_04890 [Alphaproteobacteria bacterium]|nr:hypothetical protein [Alphaproteobacteria bacterium]